jgi:type I restriction enzyme S subunit
MSESFKKLGEVADIETGFPFKSSDFTEIGVPVIRMSDLTQGSVDLSGAAKVKTSALEGLKKFRLIRGDFLFGLSGSLDAYGVHDSDAEAYLNQRVGRLQALESEPSNYSYLSHVLSSDVYRSYAYRVASGIAQLNISPNQVRDLPIFYPSLPEQQKISQILDTLDTQIQKTEALIAKLEKLKEGLLHDLLTRGIDQNGQLRPTPEQAPVLYKESALGLIPEEWICSELQDLLDCPTRSGLYKPSTFHGRGAPMIQMGNIFSSELVSFEKVGRVSVTPSELKIFGLEDGDLLFARRSLVLEGAGKASLVKDLPEPSTFESSIVRLRLRRNVILPYFAIAFLQSSFSYSNRRKFIRQVAVSGVSSADIRQFRCLVPPLEEQQTIVSFLKASRLRVASERETLAKLKKQKAGLMDDLLTGYVRVTPLIKDAV